MGLMLLGVVIAGALMSPGRQPGPGAVSICVLALDGAGQRWQEVAAVGVDGDPSVLSAAWTDEGPVVVTAGDQHWLYRPDPGRWLRLHRGFPVRHGAGGG